MRAGDDLFFAPGVLFSELDLAGPGFTEQYRSRIDGFYLDPVRLCIGGRHAFAAGLLLVSTIDFMAGLHHSADSLDDRKVGSEFRAFARQHLRSFATKDLASRLL